MKPVSSSFYLRHILLAASVFLCYLALSHMSQDCFRFYFGCFFIREFAHSVLFPAGTFLAALFLLIFIVLLNGSNKQVLRVHARWVVALVANAKMFWNHSKVDHPRNPVCLRHDLKFSAASGNLQNTISKRQLCGLPIPAIAIICFSRKPPKSFQLFWGKLIDKSGIVSKNLFGGCAHFASSFFQRASAAFRACFAVLAFAFPVPALPPLRPRATACLFFIKFYRQSGHIGGSVGSYLNQALNTSLNRTFGFVFDSCIKSHCSLNSASKLLRRINSLAYSISAPILFLKTIPKFSATACACQL